jgi:hypothetical protein
MAEQSPHDRLGGVNAISIAVPEPEKQEVLAAIVARKAEVTSA